MKLRVRTMISVKSCGILVMVLVALYVGSYIGLSASGRYEPAAIGSNGVKWYEWAPSGFVTDYKWNSSLCRFYGPLWCVDVHIWHTDAARRSGRYPINEVKREEIWKVYKAVGL